MDEWAQQGKPRADERLRRRTQELLEDLMAPDDHENLIARGEAFIGSATAG